jgi:hypothetical protein
VSADLDTSIHGAYSAPQDRRATYILNNSWICIASSRGLSKPTFVFE